MPARDTSSSMWSRMSMRRKAMLAVVALGIGLYVRRRRRSGSQEYTVSGGTDSQSVDHDTTQSVRHEHPDADASRSNGQSLGRRLAMMVVSTVVVSLARRAFRRFRRGR